MPKETESKIATAKREVDSYRLLEDRGLKNTVPEFLYCRTIAGSNINIIVMEEITTDLNKYLVSIKGKPMSELTKLNIEHSLFSLLASWHNQDMVHTDIKELNIGVVLNKENSEQRIKEFKFFDLGGVTDLRNKSENAFKPGDSRYKAPEKEEELKNGFRFDVFAMGVVLAAIEAKDDINAFEHKFKTIKYQFNGLMSLTKDYVPDELNQNISNEPDISKEQRINLIEYILTGKPEKYPKASKARDLFYILLHVYSLMADVKSKDRIANQNISKFFDETMESSGNEVEQLATKFSQDSGFIPTRLDKHLIAIEKLIL